MSAAPSLLFDAPGPRARRRHLVVGVLGTLALLALLVLVVRGLVAKDQFTAPKWEVFLEPSTWVSFLLPGLRATLVAAFFSVILAIVLGVLLGIGRLSELRVVRVACGVFVEFFRAVPVLMMMLFAYYLFLFGLRITGENLSLYGVIAGLTFYNSSVIAELIRSGVGSLPAGQREAGLAVGLRPSQTMTSVLLPQAVTAMLPSLLSQLVVIVKDTALGYLILYPELVRSGQNLASGNGNLIPTFLVLAVIFIAINYALTRAARLLEVILMTRRGRTGPRADAGLEPAMAPSAAGVAGPS